MLRVYTPDPDDLQGQLTQALRAADAQRSVASGLWQALTGLRLALDACQDDEQRDHLRRLGQELQQAHQGAAHLAREYAGHVALLTPRVAAIADASLRGVAA